MEQPKYFGRDRAFCCIGPGRAFFRVFGYGLDATDTRRHGLTFSERMGLTDVIRIGRWAIRTLRPLRLKTGGE